MPDPNQPSPAGAPNDPGLSPVVHRNIESLTRMRERDVARRTASDRIADAVTAFAGTMWCVYAHAAIFGGWLVCNSGKVPGVTPWDPYPFVMLAMFASVEAIFLSTFILISQNRMQRQSDRRAELDLQISLLTEHELTRAVELLDSIARRVGVDVASQVPAQELRDIKRDVNPEKVVAEIERAQE